MSLIFRQLFELESSTYTYILGDSATREAIIIDPVLETLERDLSLLEEMGLKLKYILETHVHADHITSAGQLKQKTKAEIVLGVGTGLVTADQLMNDDESLTFGAYNIKAIATPGHTEGCTSYYTGSIVFTGDALLIRGCGRTDFQGGSAKTLFNSVREKLFKLPDETLVYPGHDYKGRMCSSIGEEKIHNLRLKLENTQDQFIKIMDDLNLAKPKKIDIAVPANLKHGL